MDTHEGVKAREEQVFAFDVPLDMSAEEAARLIDEICPEGFYPWQSLVWPEAGVRVFCKRSKATNPEALVEARIKAAGIVRRVKDAEDALADGALAEMLRANPRITPSGARLGLGRRGFRRGHAWIADALERAKAAGR